jgi:inhibitor of KinA sporulation pathway (predicted exonuclease)
MRLKELLEMNLEDITVIDVESTCWDKKEEQGTQPNEIIEIGIAVIKNGIISKMPELIIKPKFSRISPFCERLTSLTQSQVDKGVSPEEGLRKLESLIVGNTVVSYGNYDINMLNKMMTLYNTKIKLPANHINVRELAAKKLFNSSDPKQAPSNPTSSMEKIGLKFEGKNHRGNDDAYNVARLYLFLTRHI